MHAHICKKGKGIESIPEFYSCFVAPFFFYGFVHLVDVVYLLYILGRYLNTLFHHIYIYIYMNFPFHCLVYYILCSFYILVQLLHSISSACMFCGVSPSIKLDFPFTYILYYISKKKKGKLNFCSHLLNLVV